MELRHFFPPLFSWPIKKSQKLPKVTFRIWMMQKISEYQNPKDGPGAYDKVLRSDFGISWYNRNGGLQIRDLE
jgi:hypothetical protein